ncbi:hypothetical protein FHR90_003330 [Endobacter medicaginis]|uniref:Uncharacterized protein n=1 Tax=Endobacter medicaginis TaxID=1181271 RepID=A0A839V4X0_9PROT|nr:hypothetical protein [Endobacter medicaginis]
MDEDDEKMAPADVEPVELSEEYDSEPQPPVTGDVQ